MKKFGIFLLLLLTAVAMDRPVGAAVPDSSIRPGSYRLEAINNHRPESYKNSDQYWESLQKVKLEMGGQEQFKDLPELGMKLPYVGKISLAGHEYGVIVDVRAEEKRLYIDTDGDNSFAGETYSLLLNEWYGLQIYWVNGSEPITINGNFNANTDHKAPLEIMVTGFLNRPGVLFEEKPYLLISVRTWFLAEIDEAGFEKLAAVVDFNNNGDYNDPVDQLFIDYNDDGLFDESEAIARKKGITIKRNKQVLKVDWAAYPDQLQIGGE